MTVTLFLIFIVGTLIFINELIGWQSGQSPILSTLKRINSLRTRPQLKSLKEQLEKICYIDSKYHYKYNIKKAYEAQARDIERLEEELKKFKEATQVEVRPYAANKIEKSPLRTDQTLTSAMILGQCSISSISNIEYYDTPSKSYRPVNKTVEYLLEELAKQKAIIAELTDYIYEEYE